MYGTQEFGDGPGGPMIQGKWINRLNGNIINVRDSIINGDEMLVITDKGQLSMEEFSRNYVQASADIYDDKGHVIGREELNPSDIIVPKKPQTIKPSSKKKNILNEPIIANDDFKEAYFEDDFYVTNSDTNIVVDNAVDNSKDSEKTTLIKKIFDKTTLPQINLDIEWTSFPKNELEMLMNYFDVTKEEIAEYLSRNIEKSAITAAVNRFLDSKFMN